MTVFGFNQYIVQGRFNDLTNSTVLQLIKDSGARALLVWQWDFNRNGAKEVSNAQMVQLANACKQYGIELWVVLCYDPAAAKSLVAALGDLCNHYEVCKEPHISGYCSASATLYADRWRDVVTACRQVNPNALYGGPVSGRPTNRREWFETWLRDCADIINPQNTFLSYHWYSHYSGSLPTQAQLIQNAKTQIPSDIAAFKQLCRSVLGYELPVALTELNWTADPSVARWDEQEAFMTEWTNAAMNALKDVAWAAFFWNLGGVWENTMSIIKPGPAYTKKPQYNAIKGFLQQVPQPPPPPPPETISLNVTAGTGGTVSPSGSRTLTIGQAYSFKATANRRYRFSRWSGVNTSTRNPLPLVATQNMDGKSF